MISHLFRSLCRMSFIMYLVGDIEVPGVSTQVQLGETGRN